MMCQKWFAKFHAVDVSMDDAPQSGRPAKVNSNQIETLIENNQCYATQEITNILKISKSVQLLVKMKNVSFILWKKLNKLFGQPNILSQILQALRQFFSSTRWVNAKELIIWRLLFIYSIQVIKPTFSLLVIL